MRHPVDLAVAGAIGFGAVYHDVDKFCLSNSSVLPKSSSHDSVICSCAADLNMDGHNELVLGTSGRNACIPYSEMARVCRAQKNRQTMF